jgi:hypothetical protein
MYCIECGAQIPDNSKFCQHCGTKQTEGIPSVKEQIVDVIIENEITRQVVESHKSSLNYQFLKKSMGWYLAWVVLHLGFLLIGSDGIFTKGSKTDDFWPFMSSSYDGGIGEYDIREFLVYTIFPFTILIIIGLVKNNETVENKTENND